MEHISNFLKTNYRIKVEILDGNDEPIITMYDAVYSNVDVTANIAYRALRQFQNKQDQAEAAMDAQIKEEDF